MVLLARWSGPAAYGTYAIVAGVYAIFVSVGQLGIGAYLMRMRAEPTRLDLDQAFTMLFSTSILLWVPAAGSAAFLRYWTKVDNIELVALIMFGMLLPQLCLLVPAAMLEHKLEYRSIAKIELAAQLLFYASGLFLASLRSGVWALVAAAWVHILFTCVAMFACAAYRPSFAWNCQSMREMARYGLSYAGSTWAWQMRLLVNSLIVGRFAGPEVAGAISICIRIVEALSIAKSVALRVSFPAFGKMRSDLGRTVQAINEGTILQVFALALPIAIFGFLSPFVLGHAFGKDWAAVTSIFPFIATSAIISAIFALPCSALMVRGNNWPVVWFGCLYVLFFLLASLLFVPRLGLLGYGLAELVAYPAYLLLYAACARVLPGLDFRSSLIWACAFIAVIFWTRLGIVVLICAALPALMAQSRYSLFACWSRVRALIS
jgi:O-antigen/teichoic acid export membrane protein